MIHFVTLYTMFTTALRRNHRDETGSVSLEQVLITGGLVVVAAAAAAAIYVAYNKAVAKI